MAQTGPVRDVEAHRYIAGQAQGPPQIARVELLVVVQGAQRRNLVADEGQRIVAVVEQTQHTRMAQPEHRVAAPNEALLGLGASVANVQEIQRTGLTRLFVPGAEHKTISVIFELLAELPLTVHGTDKQTGLGAPWQFAPGIS